MPLQLSIGKILMQMSLWALRAFSDPEFYFCFQFFRSVDLFPNRIDPKRKKMSQSPYPQTRLHMGLVNGSFWGFLAGICGKRCVKKSEKFNIPSQLHLSELTDATLWVVLKT